MHAQPESVLAEGLARLALPATLVPRLMAFLAELEKWNFAYNLTAVRDPAEMVVRHLLDSLAVLPLLQSGPAGRVLDVGAGAGLPSIPCAIAAPALAITGLDSNGKKARFMRHAQRALALDNFSVIEGRVEAVPATAPYGVITSRAFASLVDFFTLTRPLMAPDGVWVAMKGKLLPEERAAIPADVEILDVRSLSVPGLDEARCAVIARLKHP
jgi:16S rRNA (guanine527-N7)-methyltransferase